MKYWEQIIYHDDFKNTLIALGIFLALLLFRRLFTKYIYKMLIRLFRKTPTELFTQTLLAYERPVQWLFIVIGLYVSIDYFPYIEQSNLLFRQAVQASIIFLISWGLYNLTSSTSVIFANFNKRTQIALDDILVPFISKALRFIIVAISVTVILEIFDYEISGFIAGLGLGGLAFALAAQDIIANLFGGIVILIERPFTIGDWVSTPSVEGTVEDITFRSTKVRTIAEELVTVPNATLADEAITNSSEREKRLVMFNLRLTYGITPEKMKGVVHQIRQMLGNHSEIHSDTIYVTFDQYGENGAEIFLYFFTITTAWGEYLVVKEDVNLRIMNILEEADVTVAVPSRRLYNTSEAAGQKSNESLD